MPGNRRHKLSTLKSLDISKPRLFSADFTNMFTNLEHNVIRNNIKDPLLICFKNTNEKFVAYNGYNKVVIYK